jgi:hypothetical protein
MRVIVCGSRRWHDRQRIADRLGDLPGDTVIVHGGAKGADRIAEAEAHKWGLLTEPHLPEYHLYGPKKAPLVRNTKMASLGADLCIAWWDGLSTGTKHMIDQANKYGIPVEVINK